MRGSGTGLVSLRAVVVAAALLVSAPAALARTVDLALVLAVDVSGSVNTERYELQRQGYAQAFKSPAVLEAIAAGEHHAIAVTLVEWSGTGHQRQMIGWTVIADSPSAEAFASAVSETPRVFSDWTSISGALDFAVELFADAQVEPVRRVIDVSGDGINNNGRTVNDARDAAVHQGITINGLPILTEYPSLDSYYRENVIGGQGAFAVAVNDFPEFAAAILNKLVREIADRGAPPSPDTGSAGVVGEQNRAVLDADTERPQAFAEARAAQTVTVFHAKQRAMRRAEEMPAVAIEEAVGQEIERRAHMRAGIFVSADDPGPAQDEHGEEIGTGAEAKSARAAFGDLVEAAEMSAHAAMPAILQMSRHSAADTGTTESRDCRTSAKSPSRGSALMAASATAFFTGSSGLMSTMTKRPFSSPGSG